MSLTNQHNNQQPTPEVENYVGYYSLSGDPLAPDTGDFFVTPRLQKLIGLLDYLAHYSHKLLVVSGLRGAGKSRLLQQFVQQLQPEDERCQIMALALDTPNQVLREITHQLGIPVEDSFDMGQLIQSLRDYLLDLEADAISCLIVIDNAHVFKSPVLEMLCELVQDSRDVLHVLLFGQPALLTKLRDTEQIKQNEQLMSAYQLAAFSLTESEQYLCSLFESIGDQSKNPFSDSDYLKIQQQSGGVPSQIHVSARLILKQGIDRLLEQKRPPKFLWLAGSLVGVVLLGIVGVFWAWEDDQSVVITKPEKRLTTSLVTSKVTSGKVQRVARTEVAARAEGLVLASPQIQLEQGLPEQYPEDNVAADPEVLAKPEEALGQAIAEEFEPPAEVASEAEEALAEGAKKEDRLVSEQLEYPDPIASTVIPEIASVSNSAEPEQDQHPVYSRHEQLILDFDADKFTIQLLGLRSELAIKELIASVPEDDSYRYFETQHQGGPWFVLIYGHFLSRAQAEHAASILPKRIGANSIWIRRVSGIQKILAQRRVR